MNFQRILSMFGDITGYEASFNEIRINGYISDTVELCSCRVWTFEKMCR
ncbi:hypothetical protein [Clostridium sp.]|nr:hypothetical protein [Clostridium sp.]